MSEAQLVAHMIAKLTSLTQVMLGEAILSDELYAFLKEQKIH